MVDTQQALVASGYVADTDLVSSLFLADALGKPLLIEGEAGVGKTEVAKCLAQIHDAQLIRLQCYEGLDAQHALYDWDYQRQLLAIQMLGNADPSSLKSTLYSEDYLVRRPLLAAIDSQSPVVLLIDEIDRADEEFEALLLEILSDFQVSIPELGTYCARSRPRVILTSNGIRELSDALRRRCLFHYMDYPDRDKERRIVRAHLPDIEQRLVNQLVDVMQKLPSLQSLLCKVLQPYSRLEKIAPAWLRFSQTWKRCCPIPMSNHRHWPVQRENSSSGSSRRLLSILAGK